METKRTPKDKKMTIRDLSVMRGERIVGGMMKETADTPNDGMSVEGQGGMDPVQSPYTFKIRIKVHIPT